MAKLIVSLLICQALSVSVYPGAKIYASQEVFSNFLSSYITYFNDVAINKPIKDVDIDIHMLFTKMQFNFFNITHNNFIIHQNQASLMLSSPNQLVLTLTNLDLLVTADFNLKWFGSYHGSTAIYFKGANITLPIAVGHPGAEISITFDKMKIFCTNSVFHFTSNNRFLELLGYSEYIWPINHLDEFLIMHALSKFPESLNPYLTNIFSNLSYEEIIGNTEIAINYHVLEFDVPTPEYMQFGIVAGFLVPRNPFDSPPIIAMNASVNWTATGNFRIQLTDYMFNTYLWALSDAGYLNITISGGTYPMLKGFLTTTGMSLLVPGLEEAFGSNKPITAYCGAGQYPYVTIVPGQVQLQTAVVCSFYVVISITSKYAFTIAWDISSEMFGELVIEQGKIYLTAQINAAKTVFSNFVLVNSAIGQFNVTGLESALNFGIESVVAFINPEIGQYAIPIPTLKFMNLTQPVLLANYRVVEISGEPEFIL